MTVPGPTGQSTHPPENLLLRWFQGPQPRVPPLPTVPKTEVTAPRGALALKGERAGVRSLPAAGLTPLWLPTPGSQNEVASPSTSKTSSRVHTKKKGCGEVTNCSFLEIVFFNLRHVISFSINVLLRTYECQSIFDHMILISSTDKSGYCISISSPRIERM